MTQHFLERIDALEPTLAAFQTIDHEGALAAARAIDTRVGGGDDPGLLCGVPVSIKDMIDVAGMPCTYGSLLYRDNVPAEDAILVHRLRSAGAVIVGKTVTPEFGMWWQGLNRLGPETCNPWDTTRVPGGSSSGAGACAAAALTPLSVGGDGAGSIRMPAAFCGVFGFKPAVGRVPTAGEAAWPAFNTHGPLARDVGDAALLMTAVAGPDTRDGSSIEAPVPAYLNVTSLSGLRFAWLAAPIDPHETDEAIGCARAAADALAGAGAELEELDLGIDLDESRAAYNAIALGVGWDTLRAIQYDPRLTNYARMLIEWASRVDTGTLVTAVAAQHDYQHRINEAFTRYDAILSPAIGYAAPLRSREIDFEAAWPATRYLFLANLLRLAAASIPAGFVDGLPIGLHVLAPAEREETIFGVARFLEEARPWAEAHPQL